jgi:hypothetical protein
LGLDVWRELVQRLGDQAVESLRMHRASLYHGWRPGKGVLLRARVRDETGTSTRPGPGSGLRPKSLYGISTEGCFVSASAGRRARSARLDYQVGTAPAWCSCGAQVGQLPMCPKDDADCHLTRAWPSHARVTGPVKDRTCNPPSIHTGHGSRIAGDLRACGAREAMHVTGAGLWLTDRVGGG